MFEMKPQRRREVWQFIRLAAQSDHWHLADQGLMNEHAAYAFCLRCKVTISYRHNSNKALDHMERYHTREMKAFLEEQAAVKDGATRGLSEAVAEAAQPPKKRPARTLSPEEQKRVNKLFTQWITRHFRPMRMVENAGFIEFVRYITVDLGNVHVNLPKRKQLWPEIVFLARDLRGRISSVINEGYDFYSITSDIWPARNARSYISCTLHYVNEKFYPVNWTLEVRELPGMHDSGAVADAFEQVMQDWSLPATRCTKFVRDAGSNMVKAANDLGISHMSCIAHAIHLVVSGMLIKPRNRDSITQNASTGDEHDPSEEAFVVNEDDELLQGEQQTLQDLQALAAAISNFVCWSAPTSTPQRLPSSEPSNLGLFLT